MSVESKDVTFHKHASSRIGIASALVAAALFGASMPLAKLLSGEVAPVLLAGLLYLGSGIGLNVVWLARRGRAAGTREASLVRSDLPWLAGAILSGGVIAPVLLMVGLALTPAASASLLLNFELVFSALLAWFVFKESVDSRIAAGIAMIAAGGGLLSWSGEAGWTSSLGPLAVVGACFAWAVDNNLTRKVSLRDPIQIAGLKGLIAGLTNIAVAFGTGHTLPSAGTVLAAAFLGLFGYGASLVLFIFALRHLGTARTTAYFSSAPFIGAVLSTVLLREPLGLLSYAATILMVIGVALHLSECHEHAHEHDALSHTHLHRHDAHHQHERDFPIAAAEPHVHGHTHESLVHAHPHYPDIHHRH